MQITCPSCAAQYAVPDGRIAGRVVKCARCGEQWTPVPDAVAPLPPLTPMFEPPPAPEAPRPVVAPRKLAEPVAEPPLEPKLAGPRRPVALIAAWGASVVLLIVIAIGAYAARDGIMQAWPPSQRLYGALGFR
jgi:predicted Zn finger-like uncharacterized protein